MCERVVSSAPLGLMMAPGTALPVCRLDLDALTIVLPLKVAMLVTTCTQERLRRFFLPAAGWAVGLSAVFWIDTAALFQHAGHAHGISTNRSATPRERAREGATITHTISTTNSQ